MFDASTTTVMTLNPDMVMFRIGKFPLCGAVRGRNCDTSAPPFATISRASNVYTLSLHDALPIRKSVV